MEQDPVRGNGEARTVVPKPKQKLKKSTTTTKITQEQKTRNLLPILLLLTKKEREQWGGQEGPLNGWGRRS